VTDEEFDVEGLMARLEEAEVRADSIQGLFELATEHYNAMRPKAEERGARWALEAVMLALHRGGASSLKSLDADEICREGRQREELEP
jgi:hypothetical protein